MHTQKTAKTKHEKMKKPKTNIKTKEISVREYANLNS